MRILFVTQWFPPEPGTVVAADLARGLAGLGHEVHVLTGFPNYPTGRVMPGYRVQPYQRETPWPETPAGGSVTVHRAPLYPNHDPSMARRAVSYLSFAAGATAVALARVPRCDVSLVYSSPATAAVPAMVQRLLRVPYVLLIQDLWPDSVLDASFVTSGAQRLAGRALDAACRLTYRGAGAIGVISPGMVDVLRERGVPADKIGYTPNWISDGHLQPEAMPSPTARRELGMPGERTFLYAGNFGDLQNLPALVEGFAQVPGARLALVGDGVARPALEDQVAALGTDAITIHPAQPSDRIGQWLAAADIQVVSLRDTRLMRVTMPSKVQTALASARPVLAVTAGDPGRLVVEAGAGLSADPSSPDDIARAVRQFMAMSDGELAAMGHRARATYDEQFSPAVGPHRIESLLHKALA